MIERFAAALHGRRAWAAVVALALLYALTAAGNLSETDDAYAFAWRVEQVPATQFDDPRLLGYHLLGRGLWIAAQGLGAGDAVSGLDVLRFIAWLAAVAAVVLMWRVLSQRLALPRTVALLGTLTLAFSYGFWRYAVEADVYALAIALVLAVLQGLLAPGLGAAALAALGALAGLSVLVYQPNAIPLLLAFPWLVWQRSGWRAALAYSLAATVALAAGYLVAFGLWWPEPLSLPEMRRFLAQRTGEFMVAPLSLRVLAVSTVRAGIALTHDIASIGWAFAYRPVQALAQRMFSGNNLDDDIALARHALPWVHAAALTMLLLLASSWRLLRQVPWPKRRDLWHHLAREPMPALWLWAVLTALVIGRLNPTGLEAWIVLLPPLALLFTLGVVAPAVQRHGAAAAGCFVLALAAHNAVGGMAMVQDARGDGVGVRCRAAAALARPGDLAVITLDTQLGECQRWRGPAPAYAISPLMPPTLLQALAGPAEAAYPVRSIGRSSHAGANVQTLARRTLAQGGRVLVWGEFFEVERWNRFYRPEDVELLEHTRRASPVLLRSADGGTLHALTLPQENGR